MIFSTPLTCWITDSSGDVRKASTVSGDAPRHIPVTLRRGSCVSGRSSIGMFRQAATPRRATAA